MRGDDRNFGGHRFERGHAERLGLGRQQEEIAAAEDFFEVGDVAEEDDAVAQVMCARVRLGDASAPGRRRS